MALDVDAAIRAKMTAGVLPDAPRSPDYMAGGSTERCDGCDERIISSDMEYGVRLGDRLVRLHRRCYWAWFDACGASSAPGSISPETKQ
jgi:hypothetical protein